MRNFCLLFLLLAYTAAWSQQSRQWITFEGNAGPGKGKHVVFISGDEEYRSEEALPLVASILSKQYGFTCTVLFSVDPQTGQVDANNPSNIPGLEILRKADVMCIFTRFRELPDDQMKYIDEYLNAGKPVIGLRTATHAFDYKKNLTSRFAKYSWNSKVKGWEEGFGKRILGETWVAHHGKHGDEGTRGLINGTIQNEKHPILNGVKDIWVPTDVYTVRQPDAGTSVLVYGQSTNGMTPESPVNLEKSIMPVAWIRTYTADSGKKGKAFATTMGASVDLKNEDLRRLLVNACFWAAGLEKMTPEKADVKIDRDYDPTMFGFDSFKKGKKPEEFAR